MDWKDEERAASAQMVVDAANALDKAQELYRGALGITEERLLAVKSAEAKLAEAIKLLKEI